MRCGGLRPLRKYRYVWTTRGTIEYSSTFTGHTPAVNQDLKILEKRLKPLGRKQSGT